MSVASSNQNTIFEFPLNERFRTYLRLEALYIRWQHLLAQDNAHEHHSALIALFEMHEFAFRYDLKGDLLADFGRYRQLLTQLRHSPDLSEQKLTQTLLRISDAQKQIEQSPKFGSTLSENEWLLNVKTRIVIPNGVCSSDVAFYYQWLQQPAATRRADLEVWITPLMPLFESLKFLFMIVRAARKHKTCVTTDKSYQQPLNGMRFDLIQIAISSQSPYLPDISANKHVIWTRFALPSFRCAPQHLRIDPSQTEIKFEINLCGMQ